MTRLSAATVACVLAVASTAAAGVRLTADAGLAGAARPGRWTPVRVVVDNPDAPIDGTLVVEWGNARVHREVSIGAPSRVAFELYVRSSDPRGAITVTLLGGGGDTTASTEVPVRLIADADVLRVCGESSALREDDPQCGAYVDASALPRSMRGYDAADDVTLDPAAAATLTADRRSALSEWRSYHALAADELLGAVPRAPRGIGPDAAIESTLIACVGYVLAIGAAAVVWIRGGRRALLPYAALVGASAIAIGVAYAAGRVGPGSAIVVRHTTTIEQVGRASVLALQGSVEYPAFEAFELRAGDLDGALDTSGPDVSDEWFDSNGVAIHRAIAGRGASEDLELDAVVGFAPFEIRRDGRMVRVSNRSASTLTDCRFPDGASRVAAGAMAPGASVDAAIPATGDSPFFSCRVDPLPVTFSDPRFRVRADGPTIVSVRIPPDTAEVPR